MSEELEHAELSAETAPTEETDTEELANSEEVEAGNSEEVEQSGESLREDTYIPDDELTPAMKKRLNEMTWKVHETERQANARIQELEERLQQAQTQPQTSEKRPTMADFDYDEEKYMDALTDWKVNEKLKGIESKFSQSSEQTKEQELAQQWAQKAQSYAAENAEYTALASTMGNAVTSQAVAGYLTNSEAGPKLHHHLLSNFSELQRIQQLPEWQQGAELAKIETKLTKPKAKPKSKAPEPVKPLNSGSTAKPKAKTNVRFPW